MNEDRKQWEQLPGESSKAYAAFRAYRDLQPSQRSIRAAWRAMGADAEQSGTKRPDSPPSNWRGWADTFRWEERVRAFDKHNEDALNEAKKKAKDAEIEAYRERSKQTARSMQRAGALALQKFIKRMEAMTDETLAQELKPGTAGLLLQAGVKALQVSNEQEANALGVAVLAESPKDGGDVPITWPDLDGGE